MAVNSVLLYCKNTEKKSAMSKIPPSELILNADNSVYHLNLLPHELAGTVINVGDPDRVALVSNFFDSIEIKKQKREFITHTGTYKGKRITVLSTGIGTDNIDIVVNELDALVNIDLEKREIKKKLTKLEIVRIGTSGGLQPDLAVNSFVVSQKSIGFDGMLNYYANREKYCDMEFENAFKSYTHWNTSLPTPYVVNASEQLLSKFSDEIFRKGVTISAPGFYGPQGRVLRLPLAVPELNHQIEDFDFNSFKITNFEMESSAIYGLSKMLGHEALTVCLIIANRVTLNANENYREKMILLIQNVLDSLTK